MSHQQPQTTIIEGVHAYLLQSSCGKVFSCLKQFQIPFEKRWWNWTEKFEATSKLIVFQVYNTEICQNRAKTFFFQFMWTKIWNKFHIETVEKLGEGTFVLPIKPSLYSPATPVKYIVVGKMPRSVRFGALTIQFNLDCKNRLLVEFDQKNILWNLIADVEVFRNFFQLFRCGAWRGSWKVCSSTWLRGVVIWQRVAHAQLISVTMY